MTIRYVAELRFNPNPRFFDKKGETIEKLLTPEMTDWIVKNDRIEIHNKNGFIFYSVQNAGFMCKAEPEFFISRLNEVLKITEDRTPLRWGFRVYAIIPSKSRFSSLLGNLKSKLLNFEANKFSNINGELSDFSVTYEFKNEHDVYKINLGPMEKTQAKELFPDDKLPSVGVFIDLDIFRMKGSFYRSDDRRSRAIDFISKSYRETESIVKNVEDIINE